VTVLQNELFESGEDPRYLSEQLITYLGNKRGLLGFIGDAVNTVRFRLGKNLLRTADLFSGSGIVARYLKQFSGRLIVNDLEPYCEVINRCYLANSSDRDVDLLHRMHRELLSCLTDDVLKAGIIAELYAPADDTCIKPGERVFYTRRNALYLDTARQMIGQLPEQYRNFFLAPLLSEASIHANTAGVFKGFYKNAETGTGCFGGRNRDALGRITGPIHLPFPVFSRHDTEVCVCREDVNALAPALDHLDLVYLDPPYNQHPYGSNYFMLNLLVQYEHPASISPVSGIPDNWQRSRYNKRARVHQAFTDLVESLDTAYLLVSFNSEGFIDRETMLRILSRVGHVEVMETPYNTFRGSRNLGNRTAHVTEYLYLVERHR
jgi:adenine-specific DNA-methyltransferase